MEDKISSISVAKKQAQDTLKKLIITHIKNANLTIWSQL